MALKKRKPLWYKVATSKFFLIGEILVLVLILVALSKESFRRWEVNKKIDNLKAEISQLENSQSELNNFIGYLESYSFEEREARLKLGLKKPGESVIIIPEEANQNISTSEEGVVEGASSVEILPNPTNWWNYFFKKLN